MCVCVCVCAGRGQSEDTTLAAVVCHTPLSNLGHCRKGSTLSFSVAFQILKPGLYEVGRVRTRHVQLTHEADGLYIYTYIYIYVYIYIYIYPIIMRRFSSSVNHFVVDKTSCWGERQSANLYSLFKTFYNKYDKYNKYNSIQLPVCLQLSQHMKLKLQFTASVSNPPPDARPLSRKNKPSLFSHRCFSILNVNNRLTDSQTVDVIC